MAVNVLYSIIVFIIFQKCVIVFSEIDGILLLLRFPFR